jgi:hypothetical protein
VTPVRLRQRGVLLDAIDRTRALWLSSHVVE